MGSCCASKPQKTNGEDGQPKQQKIDSKKIMKKKENGIVIGGADQDAQHMDQDERRKKMAEAAEARQNQHQNRGLSQQGIIEMQFKEKKKQEAEMYDKKNEHYALQIYSIIQKQQWKNN